ncbi:hypothetical protein NQ318_013449 [Aromia moschata]|uniref:Transposase n=1 Tax=Aromia moschata TaxID=1265417 RepID=A0AAV8YNX8_9CUCU|nr:hypothetical protein NQ318_013449 [Aromia moschata]
MGLCDDTLIGPYFLPPRLNGPAFLHFLENEFEAILDDMPLIDRANRWFQLDGCPAHYTLLVRQWLHNHFQEDGLVAVETVPVLGLRVPRT